MLYWVLRNLALVLARIVFRLQIRGKANIPKQGNFILASNHASFLDPVILGVACPRRLNYMARHSLFRIFFLGALLKNINVFPVRRDSADLASLKEALRRLSRQQGLVLFPEGSRSLDGRVQKAKPGIGFIAAKSGAAVVPAFISGSARALGRGKRVIRPVKIKVLFGRPLYPGDYGMQINNYADFANRVIEEIKRTSQQIKKKKRRI